MHRVRIALVLFGLTVLFGAVQPVGADTDVAEAKRYVVVLAGTETETGFDLAGTQDAALALFASAGGAVTDDAKRRPTRTTASG
jgi:hypothetical protein